MNNITAALQMLTKPEDIHGEFFCADVLSCDVSTMTCVAKAARAKARIAVQPFNLLHLDIQDLNNVTAALQLLTKPEDTHFKIRSDVLIQQNAVH